MFRPVPISQIFTPGTNDSGYSDYKCTVYANGDTGGYGTNQPMFAFMKNGDTKPSYLTGSQQYDGFRRGETLTLWLAADMLNNARNSTYATTLYNYGWMSMLFMFYVYLPSRYYLTINDAGFVIA